MSEYYLRGLIFLTNESRKKVRTMRKNTYFLTIVIGIILGMAINNHFIVEAQAPWWDGSIFWGQPSAWYSSGFYTPVSQSPNHNELKFEKGKA